MFYYMEVDVWKMSRQRLIHYHTSGTSTPEVSDLAIGEIAVRTDTNSPRLFIRLNNDTLGEFVDRNYLLELDRRLNLLEEKYEKS